jgi:hypothetical protein
MRLLLTGEIRHYGHYVTRYTNTETPPVTQPASTYGNFIDTCYECTRTYYVLEIELGSSNVLGFYFVTPGNIPTHENTLSVDS